VKKSMKKISGKSSWGRQFHKRVSRRKEGRLLKRGLDISNHAVDAVGKNEVELPNFTTRTSEFEWCNRIRVSLATGSAEHCSEPRKH